MESCKNKKIILFLNNNNNFPEQDVLSIITHLSIEYTICKKSIVMKLFDEKIKNRHLRTIMIIDANIILENGIKKIIKDLINNGFDGIQFHNVSNLNIKNIFYTILTIKKLPEPYNFEWEFFIESSILNIDSPFKKLILENINNIIFESTDLINILNISCIKTNHIIFNSKHSENDSLIEYIKYNNNGGIITYTTNNLNKLYYNGLKHNLTNVFNHIYYPDSKILKNLLNDEKEINNEIALKKTKSI